MKKILVVEDDLILNKTLCYNLRNSGYQVHSANTAGAAVKEAGAAHFDLVVLDVNLPDGSGFDLCRRIKAANPAPAVIFLPARDMEEDMLSGFELGADDYVTKPFRSASYRKKSKSCCAKIRIAPLMKSMTMAFCTSTFPKRVPHCQASPLLLPLQNIAYSDS